MDYDEGHAVAVVPRCTMGVGCEIGCSKNLDQMKNKISDTQ
jgi:hypothetical protein